MPILALKKTAALLERLSWGGKTHARDNQSSRRYNQRGIVGTYHHVSEAHLKRYLAEFDFRYNNRSALGVTDGERTANALRGIEGKRLTYRPINSHS